MNTFGEQLELFKKNILYRWTGSENIESNSRGSSFDAKKLNVIEKIMGRSFNGTVGSNPNAEAEPILNDLYETLHNNILISFIDNSILDKFYSNFEIGVKDGEEVYVITPALEYLESVNTQNSEAGQLIVMNLVYRELVINKVKASNMVQLIRERFPEYDKYIDIVANNGFIGTLDDDRAIDVEGFIGYGGDDYAKGDDGDNIFIGGKGNDTLLGEKGNDTYVFSRGFGQDIISDYSGSNSISTIQFTNINSSELELEANPTINSSLILKVKGTEDTITFNQYFNIRKKIAL